MKVIRRSYLIPMVLIIMGGAASIASNLEITDRNRDLQFLMGVAMMLLGFLLWAIPELGRYMRKLERRRQKREMMDSQRSGGRSARPRR